MAAFLICLDRLICAAAEGQSADRTAAVYVSPLKALGNDIQRNLEGPLAEIRSIAEERGVPLAPLRIAVRTGDTPASERRAMLTKAPHILVTTPESLFILLTAEGSRGILQNASTIIVDEIHSLAPNKRGAHLALTMARLDALAGRRLQRIGLSATVRPASEVAALLGPATKIVDVGHRRPMELAVETPDDELGPIATNEMWEDIYDKLAKAIASRRTTLVFVNTRRFSERIAHALSQRLGPEAVLPHHGSLARQLRLETEARLKRGELRAVVATASLELGIDIGTVDLVCQIGSPRSIAVALQRIGRSGHWVGAEPHGQLFATTRDELIECAAVIAAIRSGELETIRVPENALDILAQQVVAAVASQPWREDDLFSLVRTAYPYRSLPRKSFDEVITMLSEGIATTRGRNGALLHRDAVNGWLRPRRAARLTAITSGGAIPENANYAVIAEPDGRTVGTLDEDFAVESMAGDVFLLGTQSWRIKRVEAGRVRVEDAHGAAPSIPFWLGEAPGRSLELSRAVSAVREHIIDSADDVPLFLIEDCGLSEIDARQAAEYVRGGCHELGALPSVNTVVAERFFDQAGGMQFVLHAPFGSRITRAWGLALRKRFCRTFNFELQAAATDNGLVLSLSEGHSFPLELVFAFLKAATVESVLRQAVLTSPFFGARWRWNVTRSLAVLRTRAGSRVPAPIQRMQADDLLAAVFPDQAACAENLSGPPQIPDHPLVNETLDNCLHESMDLDGLREILTRMEAGTIRAVAIDTVQASRFSHEILNANPYAFLDDAPLEERRARAVQLRSTLGIDVTGGDAILDPQAIEKISEEAWPEPRDAEELHDALLTVVRYPATNAQTAWFTELEAAQRAFVIERADHQFWVAAERAALADDVAAIVGGWTESCGPITAAELTAAAGLALTEVASALEQLEARGQILRGHFRGSLSLASQRGSSDVEWCNRRILARIHRATLGGLRREIEAVSAQQFAQFLESWQHVAPGAQLQGAEGTLAVIRQLQGFEIPAAAWETDVLPKRVAHYEPAFLDELCLAGEVMWARISPHPAIAEGRRIRPTRIAPVTLFLREDAHWLTAKPGELLRDPAILSDSAAEIWHVLERRGASFFIDLVRLTGRLQSEVEDGLWELLAGGFVTADGFDNLRALVDPKRRRGEGRGSHKRPRHAAGRWAPLLPAHEQVSPDERLAHFAQLLLMRWGVLVRDLLARETLAPAWRDLAPVLRRMEARGEIRGGRFVAGLAGEQFARPEAIELLRHLKRQPAPQALLSVSAADPLSLSGIVLPGPRVSRLLQTTVPASTVAAGS